MGREGGGLDSTGSGHALVMDPCDHNVEHSASTKYKKYIRQISDYQFLKMDSFPWGPLESSSVS
jgi:hypothetical protein